MDQVDVLVVTALKMEFEAAKAGIQEWESCEPDSMYPYLRGELPCADGRSLGLALARPTRMSGRHVSPLATSLADQLRPRCLAMPGVCAGNPDVVALGDVVVAEMTYEYDEGKQTAGGLAGDHRQYPLDDRWVRAAQDLDPATLPSYGPATEDEAADWLLTRLLMGDEPVQHPAFKRYFPRGTWQPRLAALEAGGFITPAGPGWALTGKGSDHIVRVRYNDVDGPETLPYAVVVAPMASGSYVAKDGRHWAGLTGMGVRTAAALEMEAATIATVAAQRQVPQWLVVKGVMDHADLHKDDRFKGFAAKASAEVLFALLSRYGQRLLPDRDATPAAARATTSRDRPDLGNARGVQIGDSNTQFNTFGQ